MIFLDGYVGYQMPVNKKFFPLSHPSRAFKVEDWCYAYEEQEDYAVREVIAVDKFILLTSDFKGELPFTAVARLSIKEGLDSYRFEVVEIAVETNAPLSQHQKDFVKNAFKASVAKEYTRNIDRIKKDGHKKSVV